MASAHMDTGERFLFDIYETLEVLRVIVEDASETVWANRREQMLRDILDTLFYGSRLLGERQLEQILQGYGLDELTAIKGSRRMYTEVMDLLGIDDQANLGAGLFGYDLNMEYSLLIVHRSEYIRPYCPQHSRIDMDGVLHEIERAIELGDFIPERLRRLAHMERH